MGSAIQRLKQFGTNIKALVMDRSQNIFQKLENRQIGLDVVFKSFRYVLNSAATDYRHFNEVVDHLFGIICYLTKKRHSIEIEQLISLEQDNLWISAKYVLVMLQKHLQKIVPTNISYYHFIREEEFYNQYIAIKYINIVGLFRIAEGKHIYLKLKSSQKIKLFKLILEWLLNLIYYKCSAIYIESNCVDPLIIQANFMLSSLIGYDNHSILSTMLEQQLNVIFNNLIYMQSYLLCTAITNKRHLHLGIALTTIRKVLMSVQKQKINIYLPSYLYAELIGFIQVPLTTEIIYRMLIYFIANENNQSKDSINNNQRIVSQDLHVNQHLITECWSIISILSEDYELQAKHLLINLINNTISHLEQHSMIRSFMIRIANNLHLDLIDRDISHFVQFSKKPYLIDGKIVKTNLFCKNYQIVMQKHYLNIMFIGAKDVEFRIEKADIWKSILLYNKYEIEECSDYLQKMKAQH